MQWKLLRGKWRPRLQAYVDVLPSSAVKDTSTSAFASLDKSGKTDPEGSLKAAMNAMTVLKVW